MTSKTTWKLQIVPPRDFFESCTLTVEQWLANTAAPGHLGSVTSKWTALIEACALAQPGIAQEGLRQDPRVGFDPIGDQTYFLFKASNDGTTFIVSESGIPGLSEVEFTILPP